MTKTKVEVPKGTLKMAGSVANPPAYPILRFFSYDHLPAPLAAVSEHFHRTAHWMADELPQCAETAAGLRKLLEAKDCAVRAHLEKQS